MKMWLPSEYDRTRPPIAPQIRCSRDVQHYIQYELYLPLRRRMATSDDVVLVVYIYQWNVNLELRFIPTKFPPLAMAVSYIGSRHGFDTSLFCLNTLSHPRLHPVWL